MLGVGLWLIEEFFHPRGYCREPEPGPLASARRSATIWAERLRKNSSIESALSVSFALILLSLFPGFTRLIVDRSGTPRKRQP